MEKELVIILSVVFLVLIVILLVQVVAKNNYKKITVDYQAELDKVKKRLKTQKHKLDKKEAEVLKSSINPHLFNNALNIITSKTEQKISEAQSVIKTSETTLESIEVLSNVLKYIIYESKGEYVFLKEEVKFIEEYLKLQKIRISNDFNIKIDTEALASCSYNNKLKIAPLICIDFIENAFKYANVNSPEGFIHVKFELCENTLYFSVRNSKKTDQKSSESGGFGYDNLEKRLKLLYGNRYHLDVSNEAELFSANLKLELHES